MTQNRHSLIENSLEEKRLHGMSAQRALIDRGLVLEGSDSNRQSVFNHNAWTLDCAEIDRRIGERLRRARRQRGLSLKDLAQRVGVSLQTIQKYEVGRTRVSAANVVQLAFAMEMDPGDLLPGDMTRIER